jgi:hypothetical protein
MAKVKFVLDRAGVRELLLSSEMEAVIQEHVDRVQHNCGSEYEGSVKKGKNRVQGRVETATEHAYYSNLNNNTLLKGLK